MSARLENAAETLKLGRLIGLEPSDLTFLESVPAAELRALRESATDLLFDAVGTSLDRLASASKLLPAPLVATIAERYFGPLLCARAAAAVEPARAIDLARRLSPTFLADATIELDPRRVADIISGVPATLAAPVANELGRRHEYVTMGRFLAFVSDAAIVACMGALSDEAMLRTAFVLEHKDKLDHAVGLLPADRMPGVLRCAAENDLWEEALDLLGHLSPTARGPIADVVGTLGQDTVQSLVDVVQRQGLWDVLLPVVGAMSDEGLARVAAQPAFHRPDVLSAVIEAAAAAAAGDFWPHLLPLVEALPAQARSVAANLIAAQDPQVVAHLIDSVQELKMWTTLLPVVRSMDPEHLAHLAAMGCFHSVDVVTAIIEASSDGLWLDLVPLLDAVPTEVIEIGARVVASLSPAVISNILDQAADNVDAIGPVITISARMSESERAMLIAVIDQLGIATGIALREILDQSPDASLLPADLRKAVNRLAGAN